MALPKLNNAPKYELTIPSSQKKVMYRPFLVKEEKSLMIAAESGDQQNVLRTLVETIKACIEGDISVNNLTSFDIEYMFLQLRSKSVGESAQVGLKCSECSVANEISINLDKIAIDIPKVQKNVELTDTISLDLDWPTFYDVIDAGTHSDNEPNAEQAFSLIRSCLKAVNTEDERIVLKETSKEEIQEFIDSMSTAQFQKIREFVEKIPKLSHNVKFDCTSCGHKNDITIEGVANILS